MAQTKTSSTVNPVVVKKSIFSRMTFEDVLIDVIIYVCLLGLCVVTIYPFLNTLAVSFNDATDAVRGGIYLWPRMFTWRNYEKIFVGNPYIMISLRNSALRAVIASLFSVSANFCVAYVLAREEFVLRKFFTPFLVFTMYFSGGMIPSFILMRELHLINNFLVYILPAMIGAYNVMVMRSYIQGISESLIEAAKIDGASEYRILWKIMAPLSMPVIATITLFVSVGQWNAWYDTMLYCSGAQNLTTLQYELQKLLASASNMTGVDLSNDTNMDSSKAAVTANSIRTAMTIIATAPILGIYPFLQRYFVKGLTLGGVKG